MIPSEVLFRHRKYGVRLDKEDKADGKPVFFISVPSSSELVDHIGNELSGKRLAKQVKWQIGADAEIRFSIRNEHWTFEKSKHPELCTPKMTKERREKIRNIASEMLRADQKRKADNMEAFFSGLFGGMP